MFDFTDKPPLPWKELGILAVLVIGGYIVVNIFSSMIDYIVSHPITMILLACLIVGVYWWVTAGHKKHNFGAGFQTGTTRIIDQHGDDTDDHPQSPARETGSKTGNNILTSGIKLVFSPIRQLWRTVKRILVVAAILGLMVSAGWIAWQLSGGAQHLAQITSNLAQTSTNLSKLPSLPDVGGKLEDLQGLGDKLQDLGSEVPQVDLDKGCIGGICPRQIIDDLRERFVQ